MYPSEVIISIFTFSVNITPDGSRFNTAVIDLHDKKYYNKYIYFPMKGAVSVRRRLLCLVLAVFTVFTCLIPAGCSNSSSSSSRADWPASVAGVELEAPPMRVVCLSNNVIEIACVIGYSSQIVGRSYDCDYYQVASLTACGTTASPSVSAIKALEPDLIITDKTTPDEILYELSATDIIILEKADSRSSLVSLYEDIGTIFGGASTGKAKGKNTVDMLLMKLDDIARLVYSEEEVYVCVVLNDNVTQCATGDTLTEMLIEMAGGMNAATDGKNNKFDLDDLRDADPSVLVCPPTAHSSMYAKRELLETTAMQTQQLYSLDVSLLDVQCYDMIEFVWRLAHILHPDIVTEEIMPSDYVDEKEEDVVHFMSGEEYEEYMKEKEEEKEED